jgi:hypothetical protein
MPEVVGQAIDRDGSRSIEEKECEKRTLAWAAERDQAPVHEHFDRAEHPKLDHATSGLTRAVACIGRW